WSCLYTRGVRAAYERGDYETMLHRAELSKARATLRQLGAPAASLSGESLRAQFRAVCARIDEVERAGGASGADLDRLRAERRAVWDLMMIRRSEARGLDLPGFRLAAVQGCLDA